MERDAAEDGIKAFVADLMVGGEAVPLDRALAKHLASFAALRDAGLTWRSIAALVTRAGGRRRDGGPISPDQLRADVGRLLRRQKRQIAAEQPVRVAPRSREIGTPRSAAPARPAEAAGGDGPAEASTAASTTKRISTGDIAAALDRIRKA